MKYYLLLGMDITKQNGQDRFSQKKKQTELPVFHFAFREVSG